MSKFFRIILYLFPLFLVGIFYITQYVEAQDNSVSATVTARITICGDFIADYPAEECDTYDLNDQTCQTQGYDEGSLTCVDCELDISGCYDNTDDDSGGGAGGGGGSPGAPSPVLTGVTFSGRAYPLSKVSILKDGQLAITTIAGPDANFLVSLNGLAAGNYNFSVYGEDEGGRRSSLFTFSVYVSNGATTNITGIFITPTIAIDKSIVRRGDNLTIFGQSVPESTVTISVNSEQEFFRYINTDEEGVYLHNFDTSLLEYGDHSTKAKTSYNNEVSSYGRSLSFEVGDRNVEYDEDVPDEEGNGCGDGKADVNCDTYVNLIDFSVAAYWYKRPSAPANVDLNGDGKVDLIDFSIMAFYWTG